MSTFCLVSCASKKASYAAPASDLYDSALFHKSSTYAQRGYDGWWVLSAKHGLVEPDQMLEPYDLTLNEMGIAERSAWADRVLEQVLQHLMPGDELTILAGKRYREFLERPLRERGIKVSVPLEGLRIGEQLARLDEMLRAPEESSGLEAFYAIVDELLIRQGGPTFAELDSGMPWPERGVYFVFEPGEDRGHDTGLPRVVRVGTHALKAGAQTKLWNRLYQHRGGKTGGGNHRGSVFRKHVGHALLALDGLEDEYPSWGKDSTAPRSMVQSEADLERHVSRVNGKMRVAWLNVNDEPGPRSDRGQIERGAIALLSSDGATADPASSGWLGRYAPSPKIRESGLWNINHVREEVHPSFFHLLEFYAQLA